MNGRAVRFKTGYSKGKGRFLVGLSSWMRSLACGKENDGSIFCKVDSYHCGVSYKFPWMDAAKIQVSEFERVQMLEL